MSFFPRLIVSILVFAIGFLLMKYTVQVTDNTGKIELAEKYLGSGLGAGTYTFWRLLGLAFCILSVLWLFNRLSFSLPVVSP